MNTSHKHLFVTLFCASFGLLLLSGCAWWPFNKNASQSTSSAGCSSDVLMSIDGKPALTVADYEEQLEMARKANPQIDMLLQMMPNAEKDFVFRGMLTAKLIKAWAEKEGVDQTEEFKKQRKQLHEAMDLQLYMKHFDDAHPIAVSDSDLTKYYEEKKDVIPALTLSPGGVDVTFVRFESKDKAEHFLAKVKEVKKVETFKTLAEEQKQHASNAMINQKSPFGEAIKAAVLAIHKFPSVHIIKAGDGAAYWVLFASGKSEAQYRDLSNPEIYQGLKKMLADERKEKQLEQLVEKLKTELNVVENSKYFEDKEQQKRAAMANQSEQAMQESQEDQAESPVKV